MDSNTLCHNPNRIGKLSPDPLQLRIAGVCAIATACCAVAGAVVSVNFGLGGQNLPVATHEELAQLVDNRVPFLVREWLYLLLAVFAVGEGLGLYLLLCKSRLAIWALVTWIVGLTIGMVEDCSVIALIIQVSSTYPEATDALRDSMLFTAGMAFETIKVQQFVAVILCSTVSYCVFNVVGYRMRRMPLWLCIVGILSGLTTGFFTLCNVVPGLDHLQPVLENGYALMVVWDFAVGVLLLSTANNLTPATSQTRLGNQWTTEYTNANLPIAFLI